ncbi:MAG: undecaprenyldiphospho-muramoylpentapeptide beta-N-acetylglucosaminyltransferase [Halanaerobium sp.]|nr:undecaprenyldiphospho-muramoylpentapeptide beta-N-acetylglucosaminyltransferase [Halanaerobium sp.]
MRALFVAGGTGGHIYPALAIAKKLQDEQDARILFVGAPDSMEERIVSEEGTPFKSLPASGLPRKISPKLISSLALNLAALNRARKIIKAFRPEVVVGTGGFVAGPTVFVATLYKIPTLIHEQNLMPGITNRMLSSRVDIVAVSYEKSREHFSRAREVVVTGNPVRPAVLQMTAEGGRGILEISPERKVILVFGGSQGARTINNAMLDFYKRICDTGWADKLTFVHVAGLADYQRLMTEPALNKKGLDIRLFSYLNQMPAAQAAADLVVARAGAMTLSELTARGLPAILIPYPLATDNHQEKNARELVEIGAAELILDKDLSGEVLEGLMLPLLQDEDRLAEMSEASRKAGHPDALARIVQLIRGLVKEG